MDQKKGCSALTKAFLPQCLALSANPPPPPHIPLRWMWDGTPGPEALRRFAEAEAAHSGLGPGIAPQLLGRPAPPYPEEHEEALERYASELGWVMRGGPGFRGNVLVVTHGEVGPGGGVTGGWGLLWWGCWGRSLWTWAQGVVAGLGRGASRAGQGRAGQGKVRDTLL